MATAKQEFMDLKAKLKKAKEAAQVAKAVTDALEQKFYDLRVQKIEARLTEELAKVCKEYYQEVWIEALNLAKVLVASKWRKVENIYYPLDLHEALAALLGLGADAAPAITALE